MRGCGLPRCVATGFFSSGFCGLAPLSGAGVTGGGINGLLLLNLSDPEEPADGGPDASELPTDMPAPKLVI